MLPVSFLRRASAHFRSIGTMDELPFYAAVPLSEHEKEQVPFTDTEDEETLSLSSDTEDESDCEHALIPDPEKHAGAPSPGRSRSDRLRHVRDKILPWLRFGAHSLLPSFFLPKTETPKKQHPTAWLDGLRGVAALLVVCHHASLLGFSWTIHDGWSPETHQVGWFIRLPIIRLLIAGPPQVALFFVVSGYAISHKALKLSHQARFAEVGSCLFSSVFRRHARLFMPAAIIVLFASMIPLLDPTWYGADGFPGVAVPTRLVPVADSFLGQLQVWYNAEVSSTRPLNNGFIEGAETHVVSNPFDPNLWTLPMEFSSSMVVFLFLMAGARLRNRVRIALAVVLIAYLEYYFDFITVFMFMCGMLICDVHFEIDEALGKKEASPLDDTPTASSEAAWHRPLAWARARGSTVTRTVNKFKHLYLVGRFMGLVGFIFALWLLSTPDRTSWGYVYLSTWSPPRYGDHVLYPFGAVLVVLTLDHTPFLQILFTNRFSQYLGKISYSLYLIHGPLLWSVGLKLAHFSIENITGGGTKEEYFFGMMLAFAMWWPITIYLADLTNTYVDNNCVWLARWVYEKVSKKDA